MGKFPLADQIPFHVYQNRRGRGDRISNVEVQASGQRAQGQGFVSFQHNLGEVWWVGSSQGAQSEVTFGDVVPAQGHCLDI